ncbi:YbaB/EbfC family nucleoid-associated protein [Amycolatopsis sp. 195334CR]|uniref:YbaB/EbfC family nucleoid-associated protein n=1 Tax=Amycolatopsis sp. 195334CR TaxID=2814588 RepID=UPI001A8D8C09|nr:YbaB/EbfC family nucleoid-associated protein [Amycolatopsis sp. 195334CR]MBN6037791.1 YbaB/EbfC family nucleoid-associated protein [Amycolatopsis sp. 195334CR]
MTDRPKPPKPPQKAPAKADRAAIVKSLQELSVEGGSPDGTVSLSVNTDGVMTRLALSAGAAKLPPDQLADLVLRTYAQAQRESAKRSAELLAPMGNAGYVTDRLRWRLKFEPATTAPEAGAKEKDLRRDRSGSWREPEKRAEPESDDEFYEKGVRFDPSW